MSKDVRNWCTAKNDTYELNDKFASEENTLEG